ncbi:zinc-binding dehydrogenase [Arthrobacter sp. A5]|uniref:zinc-binding dehydrogenase n=1 Tax=Arthrobacter sp. A5 TaxID=576926 RepID=UPI003DA7CDA8
MLDIEFPVITGWDVAGVVESAGPDAPEFKPGDKVIAYGSAAVQLAADRGARVIATEAEQHGGAWIWVRPSGEDLQALADLAHAGKLTVEVAKTFPLEQTADAYRLSMEGHPRGKIIVYVS